MDVYDILQRDNAYENDGLRGCAVGASIQALYDRGKMTVVSTCCLGFCAWQLTSDVYPCVAYILYCC